MRMKNVFNGIQSGNNKIFNLGAQQNEETKRAHVYVCV